jgi:hypothetical protein
MDNDLLKLYQIGRQNILTNRHLNPGTQYSIKELSCMIMSSTAAAVIDTEVTGLKRFIMVNLMNSLFM